ncbi:putative leader peptide [Streptomyces minutiscleroticus]
MAPRTEVADVTHTFRTVHLHSRPHIDLQRVAGALCCS